MRSLSKIALFSFSIFLISCAGKGKTEESQPDPIVETPAPVVNNYTVDVTASSIEWRGQKNAEYGHSGTLQLSTGSIEVTDGVVSGGTFTVDINSLDEPTNEDTTMRGKLIGHLKSAGFFNVEQFPSATYTITSATADQLTGNLEFMGVSKEITLQYSSTISEEGLTAEATGAINRVEHGMKSSSAQDETPEEERIEEEVSLKITVTASK